ncbi:hypothetical protein H310_06038 [Aphanomyces invadans]|uniref:Uncharacterized protein n=1 Tax=Aphanomyces invadans TaxID=157072 RepID=A0A024U7Z7_9STRA|nr:hypothetical protein H310_06038 [Aphanomyces invadans]ETW02556.1 hypothetical protein H310_06038 [Aphanomyces invadans]|eukprot:XP_008869161.1 hypothetical protein H310_06038 [Aphanomyces invadans]
MVVAGHAILRRASRACYRAVHQQFAPMASALCGLAQPRASLYRQTSASMRLPSCRALNFRTYSSTTEPAQETVEVPQFDIQNWSGLMLAECADDARFILNNDDDVSINFKSPNGWTALMVHSLLNRQDIVDFLVAQPDLNINERSQLGATALMLAAEDGKPGIVRSLFKHPNVDVNAQDLNGSTALMLAATEGHVEVAKLLLDHPAIDISLQASDDATALVEACAAGKVEVVRLMLQYPAIQRHIEENKESLVAWIVGTNNTQMDVVQELLQQPIFYKGGMSLLVAATTGQVEVVRTLLAQHDIQVNVQDDLGISALMLACDGGHLEIVRLLLAHPDIDVNEQDAEGMTPLMSAVMSDQVDVVQALLDHPNVDCNIKDKENGATPLMVAAQEGQEAIAQLLVAHPSTDVTATNKDGHTAEEFASYFKHDSIVELLANRV